MVSGHACTSQPLPLVARSASHNHKLLKPHRGCYGFAKKTYQKRHVERLSREGCLQQEGWQLATSVQWEGKISRCECPPRQSPALSI